jgi:phthalate 4,5-cis-dihydrodiol dehydrogenase
VSQQPLRLGIAGFGAAARAFVPAMRKHSGIDLVAAAEPSPTVAAGIGAEFGLAVYDSLAAMLAEAKLDAVYVATPTDLHVDHVLQAIAAGKHVLVEKPMAASLVDARRMVEAAEAAGVVFLVGHSHSYDLPIQKMREIITSGELGPVRMVHTWCYSDWVHRPRRPDELDSRLGGGITFRQGAHQFDILRLLCGGLVQSVRARTFDWDPARRTTGAHTVLLEFEDDAVATAVYNGYGGLSSMDLCFDISEWGLHQPAPGRAWARRNTGQSSADELAATQQRAKTAIPAAAPFQPFFGLTVVSCERGDIRQSPKGLLVSDADGTREMPLPTSHSPRDLVMAEFHAAITGTAPAIHDGRWGLANLAVCEAVVASSLERRELPVSDQVAVRH